MIDLSIARDLNQGIYKSMQLLDSTYCILFMFLVIMFDGKKSAFIKDLD